MKKITIVVFMTLAIAVNSYADVIKPRLTKKRVLDDDVYYLALNLYHEARNQSEINKLFVVHTVLYRASKESQWPTTIEGVVKDPAQFSWYWDGKSDRPYEQDAWLDAVNFSHHALTAARRSGKIFPIAYYHRYDINWKYAKHYKFLVQLDDHKFYLDEMIHNT